MTPEQQAAIEAARNRAASGSPVSGGMTQAQAIAAARSRAAAPSAPAPDQAPVAAPSFLDGMTGAARTMVNDINAGYQGLNPRRIKQGSPIGEVVMGGRFVQIDGTLIPVDKVDTSKFTTSVDPKTGVETVYAITPEMKDPPLASAGRVLSYGILGGPGAAVQAPPKATPAREAAMAAEKLGVTPSLGAQGPVGARVAAAGEGLVSTAGPIVRDAARYGDELADAAGRTAAKVGGGSTVQDAGSALVRGGQAFASRFEAKAGELYDAVARHIPQGVKAPADNSAALLRETLDKFGDTPAISKMIGNEKLRPVLDDLANGLTYEQMKALRTSIGEGMKGVSGPLSDQATGTLKRLYGALSDDMAAMAAAAGPRAAASFKRANAYYRAGADRIENALNIIYKGGKDVPPEKAFADFMALTANKGGRANVGKLARVKASMPGDEWQEVVATVIRKMGEAAPGAQNAAGDAFSANTFLTNWSKMDPTAKRVLFEGGIDRGVRTELDALVTLLERSKDAGKQVNNSRSAVVGSSIVMAGAAAADMGATAAFAVLSNLGARALTSRPVLRGLQSMAKTGSATMLSRFARGNSEAAGEVANALRLSSGQPKTQTLPPASTTQAATPQMSR